MIENIGAAMATFFVLAAVKPAYRFVCTIFDPGDLRGPLVPGLVPGLAKRFQSIVLAEKDAVGLQHSTIICINETRQQSRQREAQGIHEIEGFRNEHATFVQRQEGQFELHADAMVIYG